MQAIIYCEPGMVADTDYVSGTHAVVWGYGGGGGGGEPNSINTICVAEQITDMQAIIAQYLIDNPVAGSASTSFDFTTIDAVVATGLFSTGFVLMVTPWAVAWGFSQLLRLIRY